MKKFLVLLFVLISSFLPVFASGRTSVTYVIDPEKNAYDHNNKGVIYVEEKCYYAAIQEFKMAISLNPKTQATAVYFNRQKTIILFAISPQFTYICNYWCPLKNSKT